MKRTLPVALVAVAALVIAAAAGAYISKPKTSHALVLCYKQATSHPEYALGGTGDGAGAIAAGSSFYLKIGWGADTRAHVQDFLAAQSGTIKIYDAGGTLVGTSSWATGSTSNWTAPSNATLVTTGGKPIHGWATQSYSKFGPLAAGTYTVSADMELASPVTDDGVDSYGPGPWFNYSSCPLIVS
jgi:hypothetical protein